MNATRLPKDRDFIETQEGMLFCVVDYLHPPDSFTAYLKYSPAKSGRWRKGDVRYRRELAYYHAHQVGNTLDYLGERFPEYVRYCPVRDMLFSMVPRARVAHYLCPEERLAAIVARPADDLEEEVASVVAALTQIAGIPQASLGVTGSILLGIHDPGFSDIDLTIYGRDAVNLLQESVTTGGIPGVSSLDERFYEGWRREIRDHHGLSDAQIDWLIGRRWNFALYGGKRYLSLHPVRSDAEIAEKYGETYYRDAGFGRLRAVVASADQSFYLPAVYPLAQVQMLEGPEVQVDQAIVFEGLFCQVAGVGQEVEAQGKIERIGEGPRHRIVVGSSRRSGHEYLMPVLI